MDPRPFFSPSRIRSDEASKLRFHQADNVGWLKKPEHSAYYRTDANFQTFIEQNSSMPLINNAYAKLHFEVFDKSPMETC